MQAVCYTHSGECFNSGNLCFGLNFFSNGNLSNDMRCFSYSYFGLNQGQLSGFRLMKIDGANDLEIFIQLAVLDLFSSEQFNPNVMCDDVQILNTFITLSHN